MANKVLAVWVLVFLTSCSFSKLASNQTAAIFKAGSPVFEEESDIHVAEEAGISLLKTLEVFHRHNPENPDYLLLLSKSYGTYAFGFLENRILQYKAKDPSRHDLYLNRARLFYTRGKEYGLKRIERTNGELRRAIDQGLEPLRTALSQVGPDEIEPIFWTALSWGNYINLTKDQVRSVSDLAIVEAMMAQVLKVRPDFFYGGPHLFYAIYYASRPPILGGDANKARQHFEEASKASSGKFLMVEALEAQVLAVQLQDRMQFHKLISRIESTSLEVLPEQRLANALAKERARLLRENESHYF